MDVGHVRLFWYTEEVSHWGVESRLTCSDCFLCWNKVSKETFFPVRRVLVVIFLFFAFGSSLAHLQKQVLSTKSSFVSATAARRFDLQCSGPLSDFIFFKFSIEVTHHDSICWFDYKNWFELIMEHKLGWLWGFCWNLAGGEVHLFAAILLTTNPTLPLHFCPRLFKWTTSLSNSRWVPSFIVFPKCQGCRTMFFSLLKRDGEWVCPTLAIYFCWVYNEKLSLFPGDSLMEPEIFGTLPLPGVDRPCWEFTLLVIVMLLKKFSFAGSPTVTIWW